MTAHNPQPTARQPTRPGGARPLLGYLHELEDLVRRRRDAYVMRTLMTRPLRFGQLAAHIRAHTPTVGDSAVTQSLRRLETAGLVTCSTAAATINMWTLTELGQRQANRLTILLERLQTQDNRQPPTARPRN